MMRVLDLFSGIGGFSLGLERTGGFETVAFCEIEPFPRKVLKKHWPHVPCYEDVRTLTAERLAADGIAVDVICGGFPCQDISFAGKGAGLDGARSGLWSEIARLAGELRPKYLIVENVSALLGRGVDRVLGDLAALGFDAEWHCIPASSLGARHRRDRFWLVAYPTGSLSSRLPSRKKTAQSIASECGCDVAYSQRWGLQGWHVECTQETTIILAAFCRHLRRSEFGETWRIEPDVGRMAYGVPNGMDRLKALGNAVVPQIPELIGRAILASQEAAA